MTVSARTRAGAALRARRNWEQLGKFCAVGAVGYLINLGVYTSLLHAGLHYLLAATGSFLVAVTSNYLLNRWWTFHDRRAGVAAQGMRFFVVSLASLGANLLVLHVLDHARGREARRPGGRDRARDSAELRREQALVVPPAPRAGPRLALADGDAPSPRRSRLPRRARVRGASRAATTARRTTIRLHDADRAGLRRPGSAS